MEQLSKKRGRPPSGLGKNGEPARIRDYPRLRVTVRPATKDRLVAVALHESRPTWKVVEDGINLYFAKMAKADRLAADALARRLRRKATRGSR